MKENVGNVDRFFRAIAGPSLIMLGYSRFGGAQGRCIGLLSMMAGAAVTESAITRVCPLNSLLGIDTRSSRQMYRDNIERLEKAVNF